MSTTVYNTSKACCSIPPVLSDYEPKGSYKAYGGFDSVYVTGPDTSENALVCVYDIFGFFPTTQQGADILASTLKTKVFMPDFFEPNKPFPLARFPPKTDEDKAELQAFFAGPADCARVTPKLKGFAEALKADSVKRIGVYGFCWGAKVAISIGSEPSLADAVSMIHPAFMSVDDITNLAIPAAVYVSKDESEEEFNKVITALSEKSFAAKNDHKLYSSMFHGWAAARANLKDEENKKQFEDVYARLANFFQNTLV